MKAFLNRCRNLVKSILIIFRYFYWKLFFKKLGRNVKIYGQMEVYGPNNITVGSNSSLNPYVFLDAAFASISIGSNVRISPGVMILTSGLIYTTNAKNHFSQEIIIEDNVWIGSGAIILPGLTIGRNSVIGGGGGQL